jgi:hypothetical protein|tara:strand:- start:2890 stop:3672 length:783 start_codon:yes stop_codon:yes gene_type:complete
MFKRNKSIILDCYTDNVFAYNFARINYGHHFIPDWFKEIPKRKFGYMPTIKKCPGFVSYYKQGIVIPMWCDARIKLPSLSDSMPANGNVKEFIDATTSHNEIDFSSHPDEQFTGFAKTDGQNLKFLTPWYVHCKEPIQFTMTQPLWGQRELMEHLHLLPGTIDFKTQQATNLNYFFIRKEKKVTIEIEPLTPLAILHANTDRKIELRHHFIRNSALDIFKSRFLGMINKDKTGAFNDASKKKKQALMEKVDKMNTEAWEM